MKTAKGSVIAAGILGIAILSTAFMNLQSKKEMKIPQEDNKGFALVELFTSEGCSSCPAADELVARIQKDNPQRQIYILAYHVDYWDHQGWKDTYSDAEYTKRQSRYAEWLNLRTIYTPQIVTNGKTEFVGSNERALLTAISTGLKEIPAQTLSLNGTVKNGQIIVRYETEGFQKQSDITVALVQRSGHSLVKAGENSGRALNHVQIVRKLAVETLRANTGELSLTPPKDYNEQEWEVIGFVQDKTNGTILSAARSQLTTGN
ncbi:MAG TPA: DUF1223 domain-containing protein [Puia sp.]|jgi:hypothetical protein